MCGKVSSVCFDSHMRFGGKRPEFPGSAYRHTVLSGLPCAVTLSKNQQSPIVTPQSSVVRTSQTPVRTSHVICSIVTPQSSVVRTSQTPVRTSHVICSPPWALFYLGAVGIPGTVGFPCTLSAMGKDTCISVTTHLPLLMSQPPP